MPRWSFPKGSPSGLLAPAKAATFLRSGAAPEAPAGAAAAAHPFRVDPSPPPSLKRHDDCEDLPPDPSDQPAGPDAAPWQGSDESPFARTHRAVDTLIAAFLWLHVPLIAVIARTGGGGWLAPTGLATLIAGTATVMRLVAHGALATRMTMAVGFIGMVSTLVAALAGNALQVDLHMYYFVAMAVVAAYCDAGVILAAAAATMLHHLVLNFVMSALVFPGGSNLGRVSLHAALVVIEAGALIWMTRRVAAALAAGRAALAQSQADRLALQAKTARAEMLLQNNLRLRVLSDTDGLTGIGDRRFFDDGLARIWRENARDGLPVGLLLMDIDHFKTFNDRFGHQVGDRCLRLVADRLSNMVRQHQNVLARFGGEEFALILARASLARVQAVGERIRLGVEGLGVPLEVGHCRVSISVGCASMVPLIGVMPTTLIAAADAEMYCAKRAGRNCVHPPPGVDEPSMA